MLWSNAVHQNIGDKAQETKVDEDRHEAGDDNPNPLWDAETATIRPLGAPLGHFESILNLNKIIDYCCTCRRATRRLEVVSLANTVLRLLLLLGKNRCVPSE